MRRHRRLCLGWSRWLGTVLLLTAVLPSFGRPPDGNRRETLRVAREELNPIAHAFVVRRASLRMQNQPSPLPAAASPNWSGYVVTAGAPFYSVEGHWHVPPVQPGSHETFSSTWVGIDGWPGSSGANSVIQAGTRQNYVCGFLCFGMGPQYYAWYEVLPASEMQIPNAVSPGDEMFVNIFALSGADTAPNAPAQWVVMVTDATQNWSFSVIVNYSGALASVEWIEEAPTSGSPSNPPQPLADYGTVTFDLWDFVNNAPAQLTWQESVAMFAGNTFISTPSFPDADADGFTVAFGSIIPPLPGPVIATPTLPDATLGKPYTQTVQVSGGTPPYSWWFAGGNQPYGLYLDPQTGTLSGTPTMAGQFTFTLGVTDSQYALATQQYTLSVLIPFIPIHVHPCYVVNYTVRCY